VTTELHVHDWTPWGPSPLSETAGVERRQRTCRGCDLYQDEPAPAGAQPAPKMRETPFGLVPESAIEAAAKAEYEAWRQVTLSSDPPWEGAMSRERELRKDSIRPAVAAAVPHIEREARAAAFTQAADEVHREALWQKGSLMRGMFANGEISVDRLAMLEDILRASADYAAAGHVGGHEAHEENTDA
jgi:hypothetical protein